MVERLSEDEKAVIWNELRAGTSFRVIARKLGCQHSSIREHVAISGGVRPALRCRARGQLCAAERQEISRGLASSESMRAIAARLNRSPSTVCREVGRNGGRGHYRAGRAEAAAWTRPCRPKTAKLAANGRLRSVVEDKLALEWSPEQIARWLQRAFPDDAEMRVSHETIYLSLFVQTRGALRRQLAEHLRSGRTLRRSRTHTARGHGRGQIVGAVGISERPAEVDDRAVPGHWEGDLLIGAGHSQSQPWSSARPAS